MTRCLGIENKRTAPLSIQHILSAICSISFVLVANPALSSEPLQTQEEPVAVSRSTSLVTQNLEQSITFYTNFLGYAEVHRSEIESTESKAAMGFHNDGMIEFVVLAAPNRSEENKAFSGLNLIGGNSVDASPFSQETNRPSPAGQLLFSFQVKNLPEIERRMREANVTIISEPALSSTGRSMTMIVLDPNGVRIDMYEYVVQSE